MDLLLEYNNRSQEHQSEYMMVHVIEIKTSSCPREKATLATNSTTPRPRCLQIRLSTHNIIPINAPPSHSPPIPFIPINIPILHILKLESQIQIMRARRCESPNWQACFTCYSEKLKSQMRSEALVPVFG